MGVINKAEENPANAGGGAAVVTAGPLDLARIRRFARRAQATVAVFHDDLSRSKQVTYEQWRSRSIVSRFLEYLSLPVRSQM